MTHERIAPIARGATQHDPGSTALSRLLKRLDIQQLDRDLFLGDSGRGEGRLFGGLVAAESLVAAARTVELGHIHSLHAYFLRPGHHGVPIRFVVDRIRDGKTFATRRVAAHQQGEAIFSLEASFAVVEEGISHQDPMPTVPPPDDLPEWDLIRSDRKVDPDRWSRQAPIDIRACDPESARSKEPQAPFRQVWIRARGEMPADPIMHAAVITFASDRGMLSTVQRMHRVPWSRTASASLDHSIWFHRVPKFDSWLLYTTASHASHAARALIYGTMYAQDGTLMASVAQEGLVRTPK